jgi:hypothetical protein
MARASMISLFRGFPWIQSAFDMRAFLHAVAAVRAHHARRLGHPVHPAEELFNPEVAGTLWSEQLGSSRMAGRPPTARERTRIHEALRDIARARHHWRALTGIPLVFYVLEHDDVISASAFLQPQQIFLSRRALASPRESREQVLHELVHIWLYMVEELWRLHPHDAPSRFILPSGRPNKNATEIIGAAFVTCVLGKYHRVRGWSSRAEELVEYARRCLERLVPEEHLSATGSELHEHLAMTLAREDIRCG